MNQRHVNDAYGLSVKNSLTQYCQVLNVQVVSELYDPTATGAALDAQAYEGLQSLVQQRINVIVYATETANFILSMARAAHALNWVNGKLYITQVSLSQSTQTYNSSDIESMLSFLNGSLLISAQINQQNPCLIKLLNSWSRLMFLP